MADAIDKSSQPRKLAYNDYQTINKRIAALSSNHDHIYDIDNCKKLKKKRLLSKHERLFK